MIISIIICSHNGQNRIIKCVDAIKKLIIPEKTDIELLLIDSASIDATFKIMKTYVSSLKLKVRAFRLKAGGHSLALNKGIKESKGELLLFTDDDCIVEQKWLYNYWKAAKFNEDVGFFFGPIKPILSTPPPNWWKFAPRSLSGRTQGSKMIVYKKFIRESYPIGCNMAVRKIIFTKGCSFDETLGGKPSRKIWFGADTKLGHDIYKMGFKGCYVPKAKIDHIIPLERVSWKYIKARQFVSGRCSIYYKSEQKFIKILSLLIHSLFEIIFFHFFLLRTIILNDKLQSKKYILNIQKTKGVLLESLFNLYKAFI